MCHLSKMGWELYSQAQKGLRYPWDNFLSKKISHAFHSGGSIILREGLYFSMTFSGRLQMKTISDMAGKVSQAIVNQVGKQYLESAQFKQFINNHEDLVTFVLTVLMTPQAEPTEAMGHGGPSGDVAYQMSEKLNILNSDPQKDNQGNSVCLDHSAMLVPSDDMKKFVYKRVLMGDPKGKAFDQFGEYDLSKVRADAGGQSDEDHGGTDGS